VRPSLARASAERSRFGEAVLDVTDEQAASAIVLGSHGRPGVTSMVRGSAS
jgi:nucleotide-binding universal stress UspA family protein